ncbi:hypothetical protein NHX12_001448 [Muraenolepis orangiensis]|uniref:AAA+ ATPase domain-containing protein n=1 Tax=Muraenolepis orangiensis TaxID=630683 RepID=A0A9Q0E4J5_9TELE|nr:hypothetical protein NHX12_001448 [Muraenolepis orangiensis]
MSDEENTPSFLDDDRVQYVGGEVCRVLRLKGQHWETSAAHQDLQTTLKEFFDRGTVVTFSSHGGNITASKELCLPLLSNKMNHHLWPQVLSEDLIQHVEKMKSKTAIVQGQIMGNTILPMPSMTPQMDEPYSTIKLYGSYDPTVVHTLESMVVSWTRLVQNILKQDSAELLLKGRNPGPSEELNFWLTRKHNLLNIYHQLQNPVVKKMVNILEMAESSYEPTIKTLHGNVSDALQEARDIDLHLRPLSSRLSHLEKADFPHTEPFLPALFHTLALIWTHCRSYRRPARMVVLLQEICNLMIQQASDYLSGRNLLSEDIDEGLKRVKVVAKVLTSFRQSYDTQREALSGLAPWDFPAPLVFTCFNHFHNRVLQLEDFFEVILDFQRLEKLEFGGLRGNVYGHQAAQVHRELTHVCTVLKQRQYNPLDSQDFEKDYNDFKSKIADFECRLATIFCLAFKDCMGLESVLKLLNVIRPFLERKQIMQMFSPNFLVVQQHFREDLERCKLLYRTRLSQDGGLVKNMPHTSGALKSLEGTEVVQVHHMYMEMFTLLDQYEKDVYSGWCTGLEQVCSLNLDQPLISRKTPSGVISVNFNPQLIEVLTDYTSTLHGLAECYNQLKQTILEVEIPLVQTQLEAVDSHLKKVEADLKWQDVQSCWCFISSAKDLVQDLGGRVKKTKENCARIQSLVKGWSKQPMFCRKDNKMGALILLDDRMERVNTKYCSVKQDGASIHHLLQENLVILCADPASEAWRSYLDYVDEMVIDGLFSYVSKSLEFFVENMESQPCQAPLFEAQLLLSGPAMVFVPSLQREAGDGLHHLLEDLVGDVFKTTAVVDRVSPLEESYHDVMNGALDLLDLRKSVVDRVDSAVRQALDYQRTLECYTRLWLDDRAEFLRQFLLYGHVLSTEEEDSYVNDDLPESPPTIDMFKRQIAYYEGLYTEVSKLDDFKVFDGWFRVDVKSFKVSLLNIVKNLGDLEKFIRTTVMGLGCHVSTLEAGGCALREVMSLLVAVRDRQRATEDMFQPLKDTVVLLEQYGETILDHVYTQLESNVEDWAKTKWGQISVDQMEADLRSFAKDMQKLDREARTWDVYCALDVHVKNLLTSLRAIDFTLCAGTTLSDLLALQLHLYEEEVSNIVDKAVKEMAIEKVQLQGISQSKHVDHFLSQVSALQRQLMVADTVLVLWMEVQRTWVHLENIFMGCEDICHQLPADTHRFQTINADFKVELWLTSLEAAMRDSVRGQLSDAVCVYEDRSREQWVLDFPAQVVLTGSQVWWSNDMALVFQRLEEGYESAFRDYNKKLWRWSQLSESGHLRHNLACLTRQSVTRALQRLMEPPCCVAVPTVSQLNSLISMLLGELNSGDRQKVMTLCTIDVHARDVVGNLIAQKVSSSQAFQWLSQLRHTWDEQQSHCSVNICDAHFPYSYEYLGNTPRLVITPLTDRCYITLTQSLHLNMSGAPAGPAGTGKTETTKDLGRALGVRVCVFNCSEQMDYKSIGNIYKGLAQTGAWGCFDEFNRIAVDVLSVVAVQVKAIQDALRNQKKRPCAMVVPDMELISEIMLVAEGFLSAKILARKFITLYTLCKELLSRQDHYDWGLRAVKSVLVVAGSLRRGDKMRPEDQVLMRALRDFNMPKILSEDPEEPFILKVVQLDEILAVRHSVFVIGNAGTGKSQILRVLNKTYANLKRKPVWNDLNPKAVDTDELFGFIHPGTREWKDGLLSSLMREQANLSHPGPKWIVLDGDIDPMWIESLNTVMDDNKVLTLASNERVPLTSSMRLLFEVSQLRNATPATVSRAGILYVNPQDLGWSLYVASWIDARVHQTEGAHLTILFDKYVPRCLEQMRTSFRTITPIPENSMVQLYDYRVEFSLWWTKEMKTVKLPAQGLVFDYCLDPQTHRFLPWSDSAVLVHTAETERLRYFMHLLLQKGQPLMLVGSGGVGKTALVGNMLSGLPEGYTTAKVPFNYYTTSHTLQQRLLEKRVGRSYAPVGNRRLVYFLDDMNMPAVDSYGTVQPHTLIRQHLDYKHWYDRQKLSLKEVHNTQYVACMNPTAGSFQINPRLQRHFSVFAVNFPSPESLTSIYSQVLVGHLNQQPFSSAVQRTAPSVVHAAIAFHGKMVHHFLPTAVKFHYSFNLRDLTNGLLFASPGSVRESVDLVTLWLHESSRVYGDRMMDRKDLQLFHMVQRETLLECFQGLEGVKVSEEQPLLFCHFSQRGEQRCYTALTDWAELRSLLTEALDSYNQLNAVMNLVLFQDAMEHVCRIARILESPRGYGLMVGVGGSGKQSLTRLAAHISSMEVFQITPSKSYGLQDLKVDLARLFLKTGVKNQRIVFLLTDSQILDERFLLIINDLLASGEIPELFSEEEADGVVSGLRSEVRLHGLLDTKDNCWRFFLDRVRLQLKVVLCLTPVSSSLRVRTRRFPALVNCSTVNWFHEWTPEALQSVSLSFLREVDDIEPAVQESISLFMAYVHTSVNEASEKYQCNEKRYNYTTPKSFLQQITLYRNLLQKSRTELQYKMNRLQCGLQKLQTTAVQVDNLKAKLASQEAELTVKNRNTESLIGKIGLQTEKARAKKEAADLEAKKVAVIQAEVSMNQRDCERDLATAEPALEAAMAALNTLNKVNLTELKTFPSPPAAVLNVCAAVMVLLAPRGRVPKDRSWKAARAFMGKVDDFLQTLVSYDKEHIPEACLSVVKQEYLKNPAFHPDLVMTKSTAAAGLCAWIINIVRYYEFKKATAEKVSCQEEVSRTNQTIELANRLVEGLESEKKRWSQTVVQYTDQQKTLCGNMLLAAAFVSYLGYFTRQYRLELLHHSWIPFLHSLKVSIPLTDHLDPVLMLTDDATVAAWHNQGLPDNRMSIENAAIFTASQRWPLIIDPQQQGSKWIRSQYASRLRVVHLGQKGYLEVIERALACGDTVLMENLTEMVDPILDPLLGKHTIKRGRYIWFGGKECEYNSNFKLILHTKLANPHFPPEIQAQTTLIDFSVTHVGLEEQILGQVVTSERPDLEVLKRVLTTQQNHFKIELKSLEDQLLSYLSTAEGNFLGDISLVERLEGTKTAAAHIHLKVMEAIENETKINEARELYRPAAERASLLYFIINDLRLINPMYQFSLKAFNTVFVKAMGQAERDEDVRARVDHLTEAITYSVFLYISQGLFQRDKLTFLSHTAFQILLKQGSIDIQEFNFLLLFPVMPSKASPTLCSLESLGGLDRDIESSPKSWRKIVESKCPEKERLPHDWKHRSSLQKLLILRALRPDRMTYSLKNFVAESMGSKYVESSGLEFEKSFEDSGPSTPVFFILSPGVNPLRHVEKLERAERVLRSASQCGHWVFLQNVDLVRRWLPALEVLLEAVAVNAHPGYRVFLSGEPAPHAQCHVIPRGVLENAVKIANAPPTGMSASLHAALNNFSQDTLDMSLREREFNSLFFSLCYFHACVTERRKFGPQGWNQKYPFNSGDLTVSVNILYNYLEDNTKLPLEDLCYLFGEIIYGGHITDPWDRRLCQTYLQEYMHPELLDGELHLCPGFSAPPFLDYSGYHGYVDECLPAENPTLYGLHPNAELDFLTVTSDGLFRTLLELQPRGSCRGEGASQGTEDKVTCQLDDLLDLLPEEYNMADIMAKSSARGPYCSVCCQECERMNLLLAEMSRSLKELGLGLKGELTMSSSMESLQSALFSDSVPESWAKLSYPSTKTLQQWFLDVVCSCRELDSWSQDLVLPAVVWLPGLFNPQAFLTAVMQSTARKNRWPLDQMSLSVDVTKKTKEDYGHPPREGAYVHGLFMEGARWDTQEGVLSEGLLRELTSAMPVLYVRAGPSDQWDLTNTYECPVYRTKLRGPTCIWTFHLKTKQPSAKWVMGGVALLLSV